MAVGTYVNVDGSTLPIPVISFSEVAPSSCNRLHASLSIVLMLWMGYSFKVDIEMM